MAWVVCFISWSPYPWGMIPAALELEYWWAPGSVWAFWKTENYAVPAGDRKKVPRTSSPQPSHYVWAFWKTENCAVPAGDRNKVPRTSSPQPSHYIDVGLLAPRPSCAAIITGIQSSLWDRTQTPFLFLPCVVPLSCYNNNKHVPVAMQSVHTQLRFVSHRPHAERTAPVGVFARTRCGWSSRWRGVRAASESRHSVGQSGLPVASSPRL